MGDKKKRTKHGPPDFVLDFLETFYPGMSSAAMGLLNEKDVLVEATLQHKKLRSVFNEVLVSFCMYWSGHLFDKNDKAKQLALIVRARGLLGKTEIERKRKT